MTGNEYQELAMRTRNDKATEMLIDKISYLKVCNAVSKDKTAFNEDIGGIINGCLGLAGESGEFDDIVKKWLFHDKPLDVDHIKKELGDVMWYVAMLCEAFNWKLDDILDINVKKLKDRYPEGYDTNRSNNRKEGDV